MKLAAAALWIALAGAAPVAAQDAGSRPQPDAGVAAQPPAPQPAAEEEEELPFEDRPRVTVEIEPQRGLVTGDILHVTIKAVAQRDGDDVAIPEQSFAPFEVHRRRAHMEDAPAGKKRFVFELELLVLEPGDLELPSIRLRVVTASGTIGAVRTESRPIHVASALGNEPNAQPKPPTRPLRVMEEDYTLLWIAGAIAALALTALLTLLIARWWRKREKPVPPPPPPRPPWEIAIAKLDELRRQQAAAYAENTVVRWVDGVSDAIREYVGLRFGFDGLESTTDEVAVRLKGAPLPGGIYDEVLAILRDCDLVKFAKAMPDADEGTRILDGAYRVVRSTMYAPAPGPTPPAPPVPPPASTPRSQPRIGGVS